MPKIIFEIPEGTPDARCRSCQERIAWITTKAGKLMPVDLEPATRGESHFATCPNAAAHRKRR